MENLYVAQKHPVNEALGCMLPASIAAILAATMSLGVINSILSILGI